jgi:hypothetical protein
LSNSKTKSKTKKGEKGKLHNVRINELNVSRGTDSDSGNDSGIVSYERSLLSPYSTVTKPRTPSHSSSGHGSDNSSTVSAETLCNFPFSPFFVFDFVLLFDKIGSLVMTGDVLHTDDVLLLTGTELESDDN